MGDINLKRYRCGQVRVEYTWSTCVTDESVCEESKDDNQYVEENERHFNRRSEPVQLLPVLRNNLQTQEHDINRINKIV